jgi:cytochrome c oxidase assembly factor CtaG
MTTAVWSLALAVVGVAVSRRGVLALARRQTPPTPRVLWVTGLPALLFAWLVPFVSLLNASGTIEGPPRKTFMGASAAAILGVLASDWLINREEKRVPSGRPLVSWFLGVAALVPAWLVALILAARIER